MPKALRLRAVRLSSLLLVMVLGWVGNAHSQALPPQIPCPDPLPPAGSNCIKQIQIINNTDVTIYAVIQSTAAKRNNPWLAAALGGSSSKYPSETYYRAYINPDRGIPPGSIAAIDVPWWTKRSTPSGSNPYIDWWNGARLYIFDDQNALNEIYEADRRKGVVSMAPPPSPLVRCDHVSGISNACEPVGHVVEVYEKGVDLPPDTPSQLTEYTFAQVEGDNTFLSFNINYNISNVDQVYLPVAMETIARGKERQVGWVGTAMDLKTFRERLATFVGGQAAQNWPIYKIDNTKYPKAGMRVPATYPVLLHPERFHSSLAPLETEHVKSMIQQWRNCTGPNPDNCRTSGSYFKIKEAFQQNYEYYLKNCKNVEEFLKPVSSNPLLPKENLFLAYIYGWVPFNANCPPPQSEVLPCEAPDKAGTCKITNSLVPALYKELQDNWKDNQQNRKAIFNFFAQLVHDSNYLDANSVYAYSIDDEAAFYSDPGLGLAFAIGGSANLPNTQRRPPNPQPKSSISVSLGDPGATGKPNWHSYGVCNSETNESFANPPDPNHPKNLAQQFWVDTRTWSGIPCTITLKDDKGVTYQFDIKEELPWKEGTPKPQIISKCRPAGPFCDGMNYKISTSPLLFAINTPPPR